MAQNNQKKKHNSNRNSNNHGSGNNRKQEVANKGVDVVTYSDTLTVSELASQIGKITIETDIQ